MNGQKTSVVGTAAAAVCVGALLLYLVPNSPVRSVPPASAEVLAPLNVFAPALADVPQERNLAFRNGVLMFSRNWIVRVPGPDVPFDGLGPVFNRDSCLGCHVGGGRGLARKGGSPDSLLVRLSVVGPAVGTPVPHPAYGRQLNDRAIPGVPAEGKVVVTYEDVPGSYGDGTPFSLAKPTYVIDDLAFGPLDGVMMSPRAGQPMIGLGLLEAVPTSVLEAVADPDDADGDGISGRINWITNYKGEPAPGRFGWKANSPSLREQAADAGVEDMGLTTYVRPDANCTEPQTACRQASVRPRPDMADRFFETLVLYLEMMTVPPRRNTEDPHVRLGEVAFASFGCAACHVPSLETGGDAVLPELTNRRVEAYTDLLLHDMGPGLADGRPDGAASGSEWRTAPLWGIGLPDEGQERYLHDGRARGLAEAILWHGGEAAKAREAFRNAPAASREDLILFLKSL